MNIESYFTKQIDVRKIILGHLDTATKKVFVAVAWFTDTILFNKLLELQKKGISVEVIITKHEFNNLNYSLIEHNGGFFAEIGNDEQLMHMKFCIIDYDTVISGSANWSNRAFTVNNEEVTIVSGDAHRANDFLEEFERLKELSGKLKKGEKTLDLSKAFKYLKLIKALLNLGETSQIQKYIYELKSIQELTPIVKLVNEGKYDLAFIEIEKFEKRHTQIVDVNALEKAQLLSQIKLLSYQIESIEIEKAEIEAQIEQFTHRYIIELNPILAKILQLKKKIYEKLKKYGVKDNPYEKVEQEFKETQEKYEEESKNKIPELSKNEQKSFKEMYREAVKWCHPDSPFCIYDDKEKAAHTFNELTNAYKRNNYEKLKLIYNELKLGKQIDQFDTETELELLRAKYETLKEKLTILTNEIQELRSSEEYQTIVNIDDWDDYFKTQKEILEKEYVELKKEYVK